jgi:hypothetical protein
LEEDLKKARDEAAEQAEFLTKRVKDQDEKYAALLKDRDTQKDLLKAAKKESEKTKEGEGETQDYTIWWVVGGVLAVITLGTTAVLLWKKPTDDIPPEEPEPPPPAAEEKSKTGASETN